MFKTFTESIDVVARPQTPVGSGDTLGMVAISVQGTVIGGAKLGRTIGFPTANMSLEDDNGLEPGVYAVRFLDEAGVLHDGVANFGKRPTVVENGELLLETYLLDFSGDLYGQTCTVTFVSYLRPETKFDSLELMIEQIKKDVTRTRGILAMPSPR